MMPARVSPRPPVRRLVAALGNRVAQAQPDAGERDGPADERARKAVDLLSESLDRDFVRAGCRGGAGKTRRMVGGVIVPGSEVREQPQSGRWAGIGRARRRTNAAQPMKAAPTSATSGPSPRRRSAPPTSPPSRPPSWIRASRPARASGACAGIAGRRGRGWSTGQKSGGTIVRKGWQMTMRTIWESTVGQASGGMNLTVASVLRGWSVDASRQPGGAPPATTTPP